MEMDWPSFSLGFFAGATFIVLLLGWLSRNVKVFNP